MTIKYIKVTTGDGDEIFVREKDFRKMRDSLKKHKKPREVVNNAIRMMLNSPEGMSKLHEGIMMAHFIIEQGNKKHFDVLRSFRDMVDYQLNKEIKRGAKRRASSHR